MYLGFFSLGGGEILVLVVVILALFGASRIPQLGDALGRGIQNFRRSLSGKGDEEETPALEEKAKAASLPEKSAPDSQTAPSQTAPDPKDPESKDPESKDPPSSRPTGPG